MIKPGGVAEVITMARVSKKIKRQLNALPLVARGDSSGIPLG